MKTTANDSIIAEVRAVREKHATQFGYKIKDIFKNIRDQQQSSGRNYVRYPARPESETSSAPSTETGS